MAYCVKYIGNCVTKNIDIMSLCEKEKSFKIKSILVCEKDYETLFDKVNIEKFYDTSKIKEMMGEVAIYFSDNAKLDSIYLSAYLGESECEFYTEHTGIFSADPTHYDYAKRIDRLDYDEMLLISDYGHNIIPGEVIQTAKRYSIAIKVLSYKEPKHEGTLIKEALSDANTLVKAVVKDPNFCIFTICSVPDEKGISYKIFKTISDEDIVVDAIVVPTGTKGSQDISFTVKRQDKNKVLKSFEKLKQLGYFFELIINENIAKISLVGSALQTTAGIGTKVFRVCYENDINIKMINSGDIKVSVFIDKNKADLAILQLHKVLVENVSNE